MQSEMRNFWMSRKTLSSLKMFITELAFSLILATDMKWMVEGH